MISLSRETAVLAVELSIGQHGVPEKTTGDRDSPVGRKIILTFQEFISLVASGSGMPPK
jgi:hypothetical protein